MIKVKTTNIIHCAVNTHFLSFFEIRALTVTGTCRTFSISVVDGPLDLNGVIALRTQKFIDQRIVTQRRSLLSAPFTSLCRFFTFHFSILKSSAQHFLNLCAPLPPRFQLQSTVFHDPVAACDTNCLFRIGRGLKENAGFLPAARATQFEPLPLHFASCLDVTGFLRASI